MRKLMRNERDLPLIGRAHHVARLAHEGQLRKYTGEPYFNHCLEVARLVHDRYNNQFMTAAAFLHDTIEDTWVTEEWLLEYFTPTVVHLVVELTDVYTREAYPENNRASRKSAECHRYATLVSANAQRIKVCDLIDNTKSIIKHDAKFAVLYLREKADMLAGFRPYVLEAPELGRGHAVEGWDHG